MPTLHLHHALAPIAGDRPKRRAALPHAVALERGRPLLQMQAHWQVPAHRRYLQAASFLWSR